MGPVDRFVPHKINWQVRVLDAWFCAGCCYDESTNLVPYSSQQIPVTTKMRTQFWFLCTDHLINYPVITEIKLISLLPRLACKQILLISSPSIH